MKENECANPPSIRPWLKSQLLDEQGSALEVIGNRDGFRILKKKIEALEETGGVWIEAEGIEWKALRYVADEPISNKPKDGGIRDAAALLGCAIITFVTLMVVGAGIFQIYHWLFE